MLRPTRFVYPVLLFFFASTSDACMRVTPGTPGMPATPCKTCAANLIMVTTAGATAKPMDSDTTSTTGACAVRTFTCKGTQASIEIFTAAGSQGTIDDGGTGTATFSVTCNAAGTAWEAMGLMVTAVECAAVPACRSCGLTMIDKTENGAGAIPFADDQLVFPPEATGCVMRTFTCTGTMANIAVSTAAGPLKNVGDMGTGTSTYTVTCNAAGQWVDGGQTITAVECSETVAPACTMCAANMITVTFDANTPGSKMMTSDTAGMNAAGCSTRTFTCSGTSPTIEINNRASSQTDAADGAADGTATVVATCNAAGTGWEANGAAITEVECTIPCLTCTAAQITLTTSFSGVYSSTPEMIDRTGACATWTLSCTGGANPSLELNFGLGTWSDADDGAADGTANLPLTCDAMGMGWTGIGASITDADCAAA